MLIGEALEFLDRHINRRITLEKIDGLSLTQMKALLEAIGNPHQDFPTIHITGTNGKGSTAAMVAELLTALGLSVGLYRSPHVTSITERIHIGGEPIHEEDFAENVAVLSLVEPHLGFSPSWFELVTAVAYRSFADAAVDVAVIEVGMLGRFDATNVGTPRVSVVTNVDYDHTDGAEGWREKIAWEKAGIIRDTGILCLGEINDELVKVFIDENPRKIYRSGQDFSVLSNELAVGGRHLSIVSPSQTYEDIYLPLHGAHQGLNAAIALSAAEAFLGKSLPDDVVKSGFGNVTIIGRFEVLGSNPLVVVDGAHNPPGAEAAAQTLKESFPVAGKTILIVGMTEEKKAEWMLECLQADEAAVIICTEAATPRAMPAGDLAEAAKKISTNVEVRTSPEEALTLALTLAEETDVVMGTGSLYVVGALRDAYMAKKT